VFYEKEFQKRIFYKDLMVPTTQRSKDEEVNKIGSEFILNNKFCKTTQLDTLGESNVVTLKKQGFERDSLKKNNTFYCVAQNIKENFPVWKS
jgi:hypothetical protein